MGLSLMASAAACSARSFGSDHHHQREHFGVRFSRIPSRKEFTNMLPDHLRSDLLHLSQTQSIDIQKLKLYSELNQVVRQTSFTLLDVQDDPPDFLLMSFGIAKHCLNRENISHFLKSGSDLSNREKLDFPILSDLMVLHTLPIGISNLDLLNPIDDELCLYDDGDSTQYSLKIPPMSLVNFVGDVSCDAMITTTPNSPLLFIDNVAEMKVLSTMANLHMSKNADTCVKRRQMVVPFFRSHENTKVGGSNPKKKKKKSQKKKKTPAKVREIYSDSYSSVCESLLSVILIKNSKSMALCSLKRHGHKMPELLMKIAAGIAGIGLFAFISAAFKSTEGIAAITTDAAVGVPLFSTKLLNTGIGIGILFIMLGLGTDGASPLVQLRSPSLSMTGLPGIPPSLEGYSYLIMKLGPLQLTRKGLTVAITSACLSFTILQSASLCLATTTPEQLASALQWFMGPLAFIGVPVAEIIFTLLLSLRFINLVFDEVRNTALGIVARRIHWKQLTVMETLDVFVSYVRRIFNNIFSHAEKITQAMIVRGFRGDSKSHKIYLFSESSLGIADIFSLCCLAGLIAAAIFCERILV